MGGKMLRYGLLLCLFALSACGGGSSYSPYGGTENPTQVKIGKPYHVSGTTYTPKYEPGYSEVGMASWYGPKFHGRKTASGERYDKYEMTAAHRTLPMPSIVRVTRLDNGRSVKVRINDRGPFAHNRIIDLSQAAAEKLDMIRAGTARVRVEYLSSDTEAYIAGMGLKRPEGWGESPLTFAAVPSGDITSHDLGTLSPSSSSVSEPRPLMDGSVAFDAAPQEKQEPSFNLSLVSSAYAADATATGRYRVQVASFSSRENADRAVSDLSSLGRAFVTPVVSNGREYFRVSLGQLPQYGDAERALERVRSMGYRDARIMVDDI